MGVEAPLNKASLMSTMRLVGQMQATCMVERSDHAPLSLRSKSKAISVKGRDAACLKNKEPRQSHLPWGGAVL